MQNVEDFILNNKSNIYEWLLYENLDLFLYVTAVMNLLVVKFWVCVHDIMVCVCIWCTYEIR